MSCQELALSLYTSLQVEKIMALPLLPANLAEAEANQIVPGGLYPLFTPEVSPGGEEVLKRLLSEG